MLNAILGLDFLGVSLFRPRARYDNVDVTCTAPCSVELHIAAASRVGVGVRVAIGQPEETAVVARGWVSSTGLGLVSFGLGLALKLSGAVVFLLLDKECHVDWFRFVPGSACARYGVATMKRFYFYD
jgi:hypothetical protein